MRNTNGDADYLELDGLRLDGYGWNYRKGLAPSVPPVRSSAVQVPGRPGRVSVAGSEVPDVASVEIAMQVFDRNPVTGIQPGDWLQRRDQLNANLQTLASVIGRPGEPLEYALVEADGTRWTADAVVTRQGNATLRDSNLTAEFGFTLEIPGVYLRSGVTSGNVDVGTGMPINSLAGSTAPIYDAVITVPGTATNPRIQCSGQWVAYRGTVTDWTIDCGAMTSAAGGRSVLANTGWSGTNFLVLRPVGDANGALTYRVDTTHPIQITARKARYA